MIIENTGLQGLRSELSHMDSVMQRLGFVREQWEYYRATYDLEIDDPDGGPAYFLRINTRVLDGKLESPNAILTAEHVYIGKAVFPHGVDYESQIPNNVLQIANKKLEQLQRELS